MNGFVVVVSPDEYAQIVKTLFPVFIVFLGIGICALVYEIRKKVGA